MAVHYFQKGRGTSFSYRSDSRGRTMTVPVMVDNIAGADWIERTANAANQLPNIGTELDATNWPKLILTGAQSVNMLECFNNQPQARAFFNLQYSTVTESLQIQGASDIAAPIIESGSVANFQLSNFLANRDTVTVSPPTGTTGDDQIAEFNKATIQMVLRLRRRMASTVYESQARQYSGKTNSAIFRGRPIGTLLMLEILGRTSTDGEGYDVVYDMIEDPDGFVEQVGWTDETGRVDKNVGLVNGGFVDVTGQYDSEDFNLIPGLNL